MTPHLFIRPINSTTIFDDLWSSTTSNSPMYPFLFLIIIYFYRYLYIIYNTLITTFDEGLNITYFLPHFSALTNFFKASANTSIRTRMRVGFFHGFWFRFDLSCTLPIALRSILPYFEIAWARKRGLGYQK